MTDKTVRIEYTDGTMADAVVPDSATIEAEFNEAMAVLDSILPGGFHIPDATPEDYIANGLPVPKELQ